MWPRSRFTCGQPPTQLSLPHACSVLALLGQALPTACPGVKHGLWASVLSAVNTSPQHVYPHLLLSDGPSAQGPFKSHFTARPALLPSSQPSQQSSLAWPGPRAAHGAAAPASRRACQPVTPTSRLTSSESLLRPGVRRLWGNKWEYLFWRVLWKYL